MKSCDNVRSFFTDYMDGRLSGREMQQIGAHLGQCRECGREWESLRGAKLALADLGPVPEPEDLLLRIRVAVSQERARSKRGMFAGWDLAWKNTVGPFMLNAAGGFLSAVLLMGSVIFTVGMIAQPEQAQAVKDEPLGMASAPRLLYLSSEANGSSIGEAAGVVVEAYVDDHGHVYDYRIVSGPTDEETRSQVEDLLLFSQFAPARFFGQPVRGLAVLSFSGVAVRG
jgi:hypothetical protein